MKTSPITTSLQNNDQIEVISFDDPRGKELYWHSSAHILAQAVLRLWPQAKPTIGPAIREGFYYDFANLEISDSDFSKIEAEAKKIIKENHKPVRGVYANKEEAKAAHLDNPYKLALIESFEEGSDARIAFRPPKLLFIKSC